MVNIGVVGEEYVVSKLREYHFNIVERNYRTSEGEIDIIASKGNTLFIVEVKTRQRPSGYHSETVSGFKQYKIRKTAYYWLNQQKHRWVGIRICIAVVLYDHESHRDSMKVFWYKM